MCSGAATEGRDQPIRSPCSCHVWVGLLRKWRFGLRKLLAAVVTAVFTASILGSAPPATAESAAISAASATTPGWDTKIEVRATSDHPITQVTAALWSRRDTSRPFATITDFVLVSGTERNGVWHSRAPIHLELGLLQIDAEITDASGAQIAKSGAGTIDNRAQPRIVSFNVAPATISIAKNGLHYSGRLVYDDADGIERPIAKADVYMRNPGGGSANETDYTDADGWFSATGNPRWQTPFVSMLRGPASAAYPGSVFFHAVNHGPSVNIDVEQQPTRLTITAAGSPRAVGDRFDLSGKLEWQRADGQWLGLNDEPVVLTNYDAESELAAQTRTTTGPDGSFSIAGLAEYPGRLTLTYAGLHQAGISSGRWLPGPYRAVHLDIQPFAVKYRTSIADFALTPGPVTQGAAVSLAGRVQRTSSGGTPIPAPQAPVDIQSSPDGSHWSTVTRTTTDDTGTFRLRRTADQTGYWRATTPETSTNYPALGNAVRLPVNLRTRFFSFNASPEPVRKAGALVLTGRLAAADSGNYRGLGGQRVVIYFRPRGSSRWLVKATVTTGPKGLLHKNLKAYRDGTWRLSFTGTPGYLAATSGGDYVDVR